MDASLKKALPSFFLAGAQRAGTTSLHQWLVGNALVRLPRIKETHFFSDAEKYARGIEWYLRQFPPYVDGMITGEVAPQYMYSEDAPARIKQWIDNPALIFVLRHPIERAYSNYLMSVRQGREHLAFAEALHEEEARLRDGGQFAGDHYGYMARGRYTRQIARYRQHFPDSRIHFVLFDDLFAVGETGCATLARIASFIGLECVVTTGIQEKENVASEPRFGMLRDFLYGPHPLKKPIRWLVRSRDLRERIGHVLDQINRRPIQPRLAEVPAHAIEDTFREIEALEAQIGVDLGPWKRRTAAMARCPA